MIQPEDTKTIPLPLEPVTEKRSRGRPAKQGALTNAQRQSAFRARRRSSGKSVTVTKYIPAVADGYDELVVENDRLREDLAGVRADLENVRRELAQMVRKLRTPFGRKWSYRQVTALADAQIRKCAERALSDADGFGLHRMQAFGTERLWYALTEGWMADDDYERLGQLFHNLVMGNEK